MINLRHTGIYVRDLARMASFYREVFYMHAICENVEQGDALLADLFQAAGAKVRITKGGKRRRICRSRRGCTSPSACAIWKRLAWRLPRMAAHVRRACTIWETATFAASAAIPRGIGWS